MLRSNPVAWLYPDTQERNCQRLFLRYLRDLHMELLRKLRERNLLRIDAPEETWSDDLELAAELALAWWLLRTTEFKREVDKIFIATSLFNDKQFRRAVRSVFSVSLPQSQTLGFDLETEITPHALARRLLGPDADIDRMEPYMERIRASFAVTSTSKVEQAGRDFIAVTQREIRRKLQMGTKVSEIIGDIKNRAEAMEDAALLSARAEIAAVNAVLSMERQVSVGIKEYIWHTRRDDRVRDSHKVLEGSKHSWAKPPAATGHPGHAYMCRCWAEPVK